ncbi:MAG: hypothetical protein ACK5LM_01235 [Lactovum sp.]
MKFDQKLDNFLNQKLEISSEAFDYRFGYENFGPFLYGFTSWLKLELEKEKIEKVFFLARDAKILKSAFDCLYPKNKISHYLYSSRRSWLFPTFAYMEKVEDCVELIFQNRRSLSYILKNLGLEDKQVMLTERQLNKSFASLEELLEDLESLNFLKSFFPEIQKRAKKELKYLLAYLKQEDLSGRIALVDIGWYGRTHEALKEIFKQEKLNLSSIAFYTGLRITEQEDSRSYLFKSQKKDYYFTKFRGAIQAYESLFIANEGSTLFFEKKDGKIQAVQEKWTAQENKIFFRNFEIQRGALDFLRDFSQSELSRDYKEKKENFWFQGLEKSLISKTSLEIAESLGRLRLDHGAGEIKYLAQANSLFFYLCHLKQFKQDLSSMVWLSGFMTQLFKIKAPYYLLLRFLSK